MLFGALPRNAEMPDKAANVTGLYVRILPATVRAERE